MTSSVPYVPPDTMKKVAATSGQRVSLATLFFAVGIARGAEAAGSDKELNFYPRPPWAILALVAEPTAACPQLTLTARGGTRQWSEFVIAEYKSRFCMQEKNARGRTIFLCGAIVLAYHHSAALACHSRAIPRLLPAPRYEIERMKLRADNHSLPSSSRHSFSHIPGLLFCYTTLPFWPPSFS